jgi:cell division protein FtsA
MKTKIKNKIRGSTLAALDIGSSKIACLIAQVIDDEGHLNIVGVGHQASAGIKSGHITDLKAMENSIRKTVHTAENMASKTLRGYPLRDVIVNLPPPHADQSIIPVDINISGHEVTESDVYRSLAKAQQKVLQKTPEVLIHSIAASCSIDGHQGIQEPVGMVGEHLHLDVNVVTGDHAAIRNISTCIEHSHLDILGFCHSAYAAGLSTLVEDEMELGSTVIDIGGGITSIAVFAGKKLIFVDSIPLGGQHVTSDIARGLTTSLINAERLKTLYGSALATMSDDSEMIDVPQLGEDQITTHQHVPRSLLVGIIQPRLEEIFEMVRARLDDSGLGPIAGRRIVLTGGGSQIPGIRDLAQHILDKQVRLGRPLNTEGLPEIMRGPDFATTSGLLTYISERAHEIPEQITAASDDTPVFDRFKTWLRENW